MNSHRTIKEYHVTGVLYGSRKRFKSVYNNIYFALGINLWQGSVWEVYTDNSRKCIKRVYN